MRKLILPVGFLIICIFCDPLFAAEDDVVNIVPIPITAEEAFYAVQTQSDPISGEPAAVALIDVRSRAEYFWVGAACQVDTITTRNGHIIKPDLGLVFLVRNGRFLRFAMNGRNKRLNTKHVQGLQLSPISINIPYKLWDEDSASLYLNDGFSEELSNLNNGVYGSYDTVIFFCRSGGRSENCLTGLPAGADVFSAYYEIDDPDGNSGLGGFEGTSYGNVYNGYRGFPERLTEIQENSSVSWKDTGLPIKTSVSPFAVAD